MSRFGDALRRLDGRSLPGESPISFLRRLASRRVQNRVPPVIVAEVVSLHDRVAALEAEVASLRQALREQQ